MNIAPCARRWPKCDAPTTGLRGRTRNTSDAAWSREVESTHLAARGPPVPRPPAPPPRRAALGPPAPDAGPGSAGSLPRLSFKFSLTPHRAATRRRGAPARRRSRRGRRRGGRASARARRPPPTRAPAAPTRAARRRPRRAARRRRGRRRRGRRRAAGALVAAVRRRHLAAEEEQGARQRERRDDRARAQPVGGHALPTLGAQVEADRSFVSWPAAAASHSASPAAAASSVAPPRPTTSAGGDGSAVQRFAAASYAWRSAICPSAPQPPKTRAGRSPTWRRGTSAPTARSAPAAPPAAAVGVKGPEVAELASPISTPARPKTYSFEPSTARAWPTPPAAPTPAAAPATSTSRRRRYKRERAVDGIAHNRLAEEVRLPSDRAELVRRARARALRSEIFVQRARSMSRFDSTRRDGVGRASHESSTRSSPHARRASGSSTVSTRPYLLHFDGDRHVLQVAAARRPHLGQPASAKTCCWPIKSAYSPRRRRPPSAPTPPPHGVCSRRPGGSRGP